MPRDFGQVLKQMFEVIPEGEPLRQRFEYWIHHAGFTAPELERNLWNGVGQELANYLPDPDQLNEWQKKVVEIWTGKPV